MPVCIFLLLLLLSFSCTVSFKKNILVCFMLVCFFVSAFLILSLVPWLR